MTPDLTAPTWTFEQPLVSSHPLHSSLVLKVQQRLETERRVRVDDLQRRHILEENTERQTSRTRPGPNRARIRTRTRTRQVQLRDVPHLLDLLSRVEWERVPGQPDLQVGMAQLGLTRLVKEDLIVVVTGNGIGHHAVVARRDHDHPDRREQNPERPDPISIPIGS